jgi:hypothetical protein
MLRSIMKWRRGKRKSAMKWDSRSKRENRERHKRHKHWQNCFHHKIKMCSFGRQRETVKQSDVIVEHCFHVAMLYCIHTGSYNKWYPQRTDVMLLKRVYCWQWQH